MIAELVGARTVVFSEGLSRREEIEEMSRVKPAKIWTWRWEPIMSERMMSPFGVLPPSAEGGLGSWTPGPDIGCWWRSGLSRDAGGVRRACDSESKLVRMSRERIVDVVVGV